MKCATESCNDPATLRAFWPGQTRDFCAECAKRAALVSLAMGFELEIVAAPRDDARLTGAAAALAAAQLTPEQIEERRRIGAERAPKRTAALSQWMQRSIEHAAESCAECNHARGAHTPDCEECDCERFTGQSTA